MKKDSFPMDYYVPIENEPYFVGRLTINHVNTGFVVEIDIVQTESKKIFHHVDTLYGRETADDAVKEGRQRLATFLIKPTGH